MTQGILEGVCYSSLLTLVDEGMDLSGKRSLWNEKMSAEIWDILEKMLEVKCSSNFLLSSF